MNQQKNGLGKRIVSMFLAFTMLITIMGTVNVFAVDTSEASDNRGKVGMDYLGSGSTPATTPQEIPDPSELTSGKYVWVGLYLSDLKKMDDSNAEAVIISGDNGGYYNITSSIEYASKYLNYVSTTTSKQMDYLGETNIWNEEYVTNQEDVDNYGDDPIMAKKSEAYKATVANRTSISSTGREPEVIATDDTPQSVTVQLMANDDAPKNAKIFGDSSKDDKVYIAIVGFRIKPIATADTPIPSGTKLVTAGLNAADFTVSTGTKEDQLWTAAWHTDRTNTSDGNLKNFLDYQGELILVPAMYTVEFYGTKSGDTYSDKLDNDLTIKEDQSVSTTTDAAMPADTAFDTYAPDGEVFSGLKYVDKEGNEQAFTETTPITADMVTDNVLKVYATYEAGNTITFKANYPADATITADDKAVVISKDAGTTIPTDKQPKVSNDADADFVIPEGYVFDGWYDAAGDGANKVDLTTATFTADTDLYAHWTKAAKINFYKNDGVTTDSLKEIIITPGETIPEADMPADPTRDGYVFKEWNTESNGSGTKLESTTTFNANQDLYAIWTADGADQVTLHFDPVLEGVTATPDSVTVNKGDAIYTANIPVVAKDGYSFDGWFKTAAVTATDIVDFSGEGYILPADKTEETVYAHWTYTGDDAVNVKFMKEADDSEDYVDYITVPVKPGTSLGASMPANPTKSGKTFTAWTESQDGTGEKFTGEMIINGAKTVYAQYAADVTINYDANTGSDAPASVTEPAPDAYADPTTTPTKDGYTFIGWNTKKSGGGEYIAAGTKDDGTDLTYGDVGAKLDATNTLYAQWAAVKDTDKDDVIEDNPVNPDPDKQGAVVNFDENVSASSTNPITSNVSPAHKYPKLGETLASMGGLPEAPARNDYDFLGWNTQPDGSGTPFDENTTVDKATLGDDITIAEDGTGSVTVYAQWKLADDYTGDRIKLTFSKNEDGTGSDTYKEIELVKGDALGYVPTVANDGFNFNGWFGGTVTDGKVVFDENDEFDPDATFDADKTYYAQWQQYLVVVPTRVKEAGTEGIGNPISDGIVYANKEYTILYNVYTATIDDSPESETGFIQGDLKNDNNNQPLENVDLTAENSPISVGYTNATDSSTILKTAGVYTILPETTAGSYLEDWGCEVLMSYPESVEITPALVTVLVDPDTQIRKKSDTDRAIGITYSGFLDGEPADKGAATATVNYRQWTPADASDTTIETSELDTATTVVPTAIAKYVVEVNIGDTNYKVGSVDSSKESADEKVYPREADDNYPGYGAVYEEVDDGTGTMVWTLTKPGENIYYEIQVSDPSIKTVKVTSEKTGETPTELGLKTPDYTADQTFETGETPTVKDYGVRVTDTEAETVKIEVELTNPDTTTITATVKKPGANEGDDPIDSPLTITPAKDSEGNDIPGKYIVEVPLDNKGKDTNDVTITTKAGDGADAPSIDYTFKVQQYKEATIVLNYGNSPVGEIMKGAGSDTDKETAVNDFKTTRIFSEVSNNLTYYEDAWSSYIVKNDQDEIISSYNGDDDPTAMFVYQRDNFRDTGFTAYDSLGEVFDESEVSLSLTMTSIKDGFVKYDSTDLPEDVSLPETAKGNNYLFTEFVNYNIRPDVYNLTYTFTDPYTGETVSKVRKVIAIAKNGDVLINGMSVVNPQDANSINGNVPYFESEQVNSLYKFRVADTVINDMKVVNPQDANRVKACNDSPINVFYNALPNE